MDRRTAGIAATAGLGVTGVVAGAVLAVTGTASAATPCGPVASPSATSSTSASPGPTTSTSTSARPSGSATASTTPTATTSATTSPSPSSGGGGGLPTDLPTGILPFSRTNAVAAASASASSTATASASPSPSSSDGSGDPIGGIIGGVLGGGASATPTATGSATPTTSASPTQAPVPFTFAITPHAVTKGRAATAYGRATPGCTVDLWAYTRPGTTYQKVRSTTATSKGVFTFTIYPGGNTRAFVRSQGTSDSGTDYVDVASVVSIKASKIGTRKVRFAGGVGPAGGQTITVYTSNGQKIGSAASDSSGAWHLDHTFAKAGTANFYAVSTKTQDNGAGTSPTISVTIS